MTRPEIASSAPADRPLNRPGPTSPAAGARRDPPPGRVVPIPRESVPNHTGFTIPGLGPLGESSSSQGVSSPTERHNHVAENRQRIVGSLPGGREARTAGSMLCLFPVAGARGPGEKRLIVAGSAPAVTGHRPPLFGDACFTERRSTKRDVNRHCDLRWLHPSRPVPRSTPN